MADDYEVRGWDDEVETRGWDDEEPSTLRRLVADPAISVLKGVIGVPEAAVGLADLATGGRAGKLAEEVGFRPQEAKAALDMLLTQEQQDANRRVQETKGFLPTIGASLENPSTIAHSAIESLPSMGAGGVVGRGILAAAPKVAPLIAGAIGEGAVSAGQAAEQVRQATDDGLLTPGQSALAAGSGTLTGLLGAAGGKIAQRFGFADIDTMLASGTTAAAKQGLARRVIGGAISEGLLEEMPQSSQEQIAQNVALGRPWSEGVQEAGAVGALVGGVMGGGGNLIARQATQGAEPPLDTPPKPIEQVATEVMQSPDLDSAINAAEAAINAPVQAAFTEPEQVSGVEQPTPEASTSEQAPEVGTITPNVGMPEISAPTTAYSEPVGTPITGEPVIVGGVDYGRMADMTEKQLEAISRLARGGNREAAAAELERRAATVNQEETRAGQVPSDVGLAAPAVAPDQEPAPGDVAAVPAVVEAPMPAAVAAPAPVSEAAPVVEKAAIVAGNATVAPAQPNRTGPNALSGDYLGQIVDAGNNAEATNERAVEVPERSPDTAAGPADADGVPQGPEAVVPKTGEAGAAQAQGPVAFKDFTAPKAIKNADGKVIVRKDEVRTFKTEKQAKAYSKSNALRGYVPRETSDGWVLSKSDREQNDFATRMAEQRAQEDALGARLSEMSGEEIEAEYQSIKTANDAVERAAIKKFLGPQKLAEYDAITGRRRQDAWLEQNITNDAQDYMNERMQPEAFAEQFRGAAGAFDETSPKALGESIAVLSKDVDKPGFMASPKGVTFKAALRYAMEQGWSMDDVLSGMRARASRWAGDDAQELFSRLFKRSDGKPPVIAKQPRAEIQPAPAALTGQSESEFRAEEALAKKSADEKAKRDNAPSPDGFVLTGSSRMVDEAEARGQKPMFDGRAKQADNEYSQVEQPENESEKHPFAQAVEVGRSAPETTASVRREGGGVRTIAGGFKKQLQVHGALALVGQTVRTAHDLAQLAQIYRNPGYETFRAFFVDDDARIIHSTGVSSRLPGQTHVIPGNPKKITTDAVRDWFSGQMRETKAAGFYLLHNHPSGNPDPSLADRHLTRTIAKVPGLLSHVVIDHTKFAEILPDGSGDVRELSGPGEDVVRRRLIDHPVIGSSAVNAHQVASIGKQFYRDDFVTIVAQGQRVEAIGEIPVKVILHPVRGPAALRSFGRFNGGSMLLAYGSREIMEEPAVAGLLEKGFLVDAVHSDGVGHLMAGMNRDFGDPPARVIRQSENPYRIGAHPAAETKGEDEGVALFSRFTSKPGPVSGLPYFQNERVGLSLPRLHETQPIERGKRLIAWDVVDTQAYRRELSNLIDEGMESSPARKRATARATIGMLLAEMRDGKFTDLRNIEIEPEHRGNGFGEAVVSSMLESQDSPIMIRQILPEAVDFWTKMGARFPRSQDYMEASLDRFRYAKHQRDSGRQARSEALGRNDAQGEGRAQPSAQGRGEESAQAGRGAALRVEPREFRRTLAAESGIAVKEAQAVLDALGVEGEAVESPDDLPKNLLRQIESKGAKGDVRGVFDPSTGKIYVIASRVENRDLAAFVALHESAHRGLRALLGPDLDPVLRDIYNTNSNVKTKANLLRSRHGLSIEEATEEVIADLAKRGQAQKLVGWDKFIAFVKKWLAERGFEIEWTDTMVEVLAGAAAEAGKKGPTVFTGEDAKRLNLGATKEKDAEDGPRLSRGQPKWVENGSAELKSAASKIDTYAPNKSFKEKFAELQKNWADRAIQEVFDPYIALKKLTPNGYILARMVKSADTSLEAALRFGKPRLADDGSIVGDLDMKGFLGHMSELNGEHDRFFMWVAGNRSERLMLEGREHLFSAGEIKAMKNLIREQGPNDKWKGAGSRPQAYAKAAEALRSYNRAFMDIAEKTGEINHESRVLWEHDFYIPFFRVDEDMTIQGPSRVKGLVRNEVLKKLKGGTEPLGDLLDNTIRNWQHVLSASLANQAAKTALNAAVDAGIAVEADEATAKQLEKAGKPTAGATYVMDDGERHWYTVGDPFVLEAISALETPSINWAGMKLLRQAKRVLTTGVTAAPPFRIRNLIRDSSTAVAQNQMSYNLVKNVWEGYKHTNPESATYAQAMFGGGIIRFGNIDDGKHAEHAKRLILDGVEDRTILDTPTKVRDALSKWWDVYQENGDRFENVNRMSLIEQRKAAGATNLEAMFAGRDSMDFTLMGANKGIRFLAQVVPFLNARLQGLYKTGRAVREDPKRIGYVTGALTLASIALMLAYRDDDEWKKRADWDRDTYFWFKIGDVAFRIPKGFELGGLATLAERGLELLISDEMNGKRFAERLWYFVGNTLSLNPIPQLAKPMVDLYANTDSFTGRQIETRGMEDQSKPERISRRTTLVAKTLGKAGNVTQLSPVQIDHLIQAYFGWLGTHAAMTVDVMAEPFLEVPKPARKIGDVFVVGDFVKDLPSSQSRYVEDFYKQAKKVHEVMGDLKQARETRDAAKVQQILEDKRDEVSLRSLYSSAERTMTDINRKIRVIERSAAPSDEKRARIDELNERKNRLAAVIARRTRERKAATQ